MSNLRTGKQVVPRAFDALTERAANPPGTFDKAGRWYPDEAFEASCCRGIRSPSRAHPYSYMVHCRTRCHVATLWAEKPKSRDLLRNIARRGAPRPEPARACPDGIAYKVLALLNNGQLASVFDGSLWTLGEERREQPRQGHNGGLYVYEDERQALAVEFPRRAAHIDSPRVLVECSVAGNYCRYGDKLAFGKVTPRRIVATV